MKTEPHLEPSPAEPTPRAAFDVVALVTSAGGLEALSAVLHDLPPGLPAAVLVMQHLGGRASSLVPILRRRSQLPVDWVEDGARIAPGTVRVCPPRKRLEVLPDGTCSLSTDERGALGKPLDAFLESLADSFGSRVLAVVLTGMGKDGAAGARAVKGAGGTVLVQSEESAEHPSMPHASIEGGSADLVLSLAEIGTAVVETLAGGRPPRPRNETEAAEALFAGLGEARAALRSIDWSATPLGPVMGWPESLRTIVRAVLDTHFPMLVFWGPELVQICNDAFAPSLGYKVLQGLPLRVTWAEMLEFLRPQYERVQRTGEAIYRENQLFEPNRRGFVEEAYFTYCYSPLYDGREIAGLLSTQLETTARVLAERRLTTLHALRAPGTAAEAASQVCERAAGVLEANPRDVPFALFYLLDGAEAQAILQAAAGLKAGTPAAPRVVDLRRAHAVWPLARVIHDAEPVLVDDLATRFPGFHAGPWPQSPTSALLLPLRATAEEAPVGVLVLGVSPRLPLDALYRGFLELVAAQVGGRLAEVRVRQQERERMDRLAELDRMKIELFSNISHEFRTPLTLLLAPMEELLRRRAELPGELAEEVAVASRNARRLLTLVDTLLDFSRMEAGRLRAHFEPADLAALTADLASVFRGAAERAGLRLRVDCPPLPGPVWVDREMWEKVVSNLLSNALKFTFQGEIAVELRALTQHAELVVRDTGVGIPAAELPHLFERFHRVRGTRARTHEGAGIGLALVYELVRRHHGRVRVQSAEGKGSTFTVWIPLAPRQAAEATPEGKEDSPATEAATVLAEEAIRWNRRNEAAEPPPEELLDDPLDLLPARAPGARVLVVDDNADLRDYLRRLLSPYWRIETAGDGEEALEIARRTRPDLILSDMMMPNLDGLGLLREIRRDEELKATPVILLTARAGEDAAVEGLLAGADDYVTKPFSARELVARVGAQVELARLRRETRATLAERHQTEQAGRGRLESPPPPPGDESPG